MKNLILGLALASLSVACTSEQKASVNDPSTPAAMECTTEGCEKACCMEKAAGECSSTKAAGECSGEKKVCPVTGKELN